MKTIKYLGMLLAMLTLSVSFVSCSSDDEDEDGGGNSSSVVGTWVEKRSDTYLYLTLNSNGTGFWAVKFGEDGNIEYDGDFDYVREGDLLYLLHENQDDTEVLRIISVSSVKFVLEWDGDIRTFNKSERLQLDDLY